MTQPPETGLFPLDSQPQQVITRPTLTSRVTSTVTAIQPLTTRSAGQTTTQASCVPFQSRLQLLILQFASPTASPLLFTTQPPLLSNMMKIASLFTTLAIVFGATYAAECTTSQLTAAAQLPEMAKFESACAGISFSSTSSTATVKKVCENKECLAAMKAAFSAFPKCEVQGLSLSDTLASVDTACQYVGAGSTTSSSTVASTSAPTSAASSSVTGASASAIAVVAAVYTLARA